MTVPPPSISNLIDLGSTYAERIFNNIGRVDARFIAVTADEKVMYVDFPPVGRDQGFDLIRELFLAKDVVAYVFIDEAWIADGLTEAEAATVNPERHPDRHEAVIISAESEHEGQRFATREIVRPKQGKPFLEALEMSDFPQAQGRLVGLLAQRTTLQ
jgi:hypothetical protein